MTRSTTTGRRKASLSSASAAGRPRAGSAILPAPIESSGPSGLAEPSELAVACDLIRSASTVVLLAHVGPDADALGSALALGLALEASGAAVSVAFSEPSTVPASLRGLPGQHLVVHVDRVPDRPDLVVTLDVNSRERLGALGTLLDTAGDSLVIDHHASNTRFGRHHFVDIAAESTTVMVTAILDRLGLPIDRGIAANIYAGLATDTIGFRSASASAHRLSARLLDAGVNPDELMRPITDLHPFQWLHMLSQVLGGVVLDRGAAGGRGLVFAVITAQTAAGMRQEELDSVIDIVRTATEAQVAAVLKQTGPDQWQVSLRSRPGAAAPGGPAVPGVDVAAVAASLGGGGHVRAAGFGYDGSAQEAITELLRVLAAEPC